MSSQSRGAENIARRTSLPAAKGATRRKANSASLSSSFDGPDYNRLSGSEFADLCGVSAGTITNWCDAGMPCIREARNGSRVEIRIRDAIPWVIEFRGEAKPGSQRDRLAKAQAEKFELENSRRRGELILVPYVADLLNSMAADIAGRFDGLAGRLANELAGITDPALIRERILTECRGIRSGIAEHVRKLAERRPIAEDDGDNLGTPASKKPKRVGGRKPRAAVRKRRTRAVEQ